MNQETIKIKDFEYLAENLDDDIMDEQDIQGSNFFLILYIIYLQNQ